VSKLSDDALDSWVNHCKFKPDSYTSQAMLDALTELKEFRAKQVCQGKLSELTRLTEEVGGYDD
jgi:hypothetical protein